ncbi:hypothetical protein M378DRAFT_155953, partial [Amanita muscaria Koide BX008]
LVMLRSREPTYKLCLGTRYRKLSIGRQICHDRIGCSVTSVEFTTSGRPSQFALESTRHFGTRAKGMTLNHC